MKCINKIMGLALVAAAASFASCSNEVEYTPADPVTGSVAGVKFVTDGAEVELDPVDPTEYTIALQRTDTKGALTVPLKVLKNTDDVFTVSDVTFADGEADATCTVSFPNAEVGTTYDLGLTIDDSKAVTQYSDSVLYNFSVTRVKWNDVGYYIDESGSKVEGWALYTDDYITTFYGVANLTWATQVQEREDKPGYFRLINTYHENYPYNDPGDWYTDKDYYIFIDATNPKKVYIPHYCELGLDWGYGNMRVSSMAGYYLAKGDAATAENYYGTYQNGKITFPTEGLLFCMPGYKDAFYTANGSGAFKLVLDPSKDLYEANIEDDFQFDLYNNYDFTSTQLNSVKADVNVYEGTCVTKTDDCDVRYKKAYGTPYRVESPYADGTDLYFNVTDEGKILVTEDYKSQATGLQAMGADVYAHINASKSTFSKDKIVLNITYTNEAGDITYGTVNETLEHATWTAIATGTYSYSQMLEGDEPGMTLYQKDQDKTQYKITKWFDMSDDGTGGVDFCFSMDSKGKITVKDQFTGYVHSSYGEVWVTEYADYFGQGDQSYYEDGVYNFDIAYYVSAGYFGAGFETFTVNAAAGAKKAPKTAKAKTMKKKSVKKAHKASDFVGVKTNYKKIMM